MTSIEQKSLSESIKQPMSPETFGVTPKDVANLKSTEYPWAQNLNTKINKSAWNNDSTSAWELAKLVTWNMLS